MTLYVPFCRVKDSRLQSKRHNGPRNGGAAICALHEYAVNPLSGQADSRQRAMALLEWWRATQSR